MNLKTKTVASAPQDVHTSAQTDAATPATPAVAGCAGCGNCAGDCAKPKHHQPSALSPRDQYTGRAGTFIRDPETGKREPVLTTKG